MGYLNLGKSRQSPKVRLHYFQQQWMFSLLMGDVLKIDGSKTGGESSSLLLPIISGTLIPVMATVLGNDSEQK